jgi:hypothetical protein
MPGGSFILAPSGRIAKALHGDRRHPRTLCLEESPGSRTPLARFRDDAEDRASKANRAACPGMMARAKPITPHTLVESAVSDEAAQAPASALNDFSSSRRYRESAEGMSIIHHRQRERIAAGERWILDSATRFQDVTG